MTFYFTFGVGSPLARHYVEIDADTEPEARSIMYQLFTTHWASCYHGIHGREVVARCGLRPLEINVDADVRLGTVGGFGAVGGYP